MHNKLSYLFRLIWEIPTISVWQMALSTIGYASQTFSLISCLFYLSCFFEKKHLADGWVSIEWWLENISNGLTPSAIYGPFFKTFSIKIVVSCETYTVVPPCENKQLLRLNSTLDILIRDTKLKYIWIMPQTTLYYFIWGDILLYLRLQCK